MLFETHAHYDDAAFDADRDAVLKEVHKTVEFAINPGCDIPTSQFARSLSQKYDWIYFAAGIHPENVEGCTVKDLDAVRELAADPKCVAVGEIGLDYYWDTTYRELQKELFLRQCEMAVELDKPVIIHDREAHGDSLDTAKSVKGLRGVFHCYSGSAEMAEELIKMGFYLGFDGPVTYKNNKKAAEVLKVCPPDRILIETDSPYMSPVPVRGKRNDSGNLKYIAEKIAEILEIPADEIVKITNENARKCFF